MAELIALNRSEPCDTCHAPVDAPCADLRSYDGDLYGTRVHPSRRLKVRRAHGW